MRPSRRRMFTELIQTLLDLANEKTRTVEGKRLLAGCRIARNGTRTCPESVAVAGYFGSVTGLTEDGDFLTEDTLEDLGEQLREIATECPDEVLVFSEEQPYDEKGEQFET